MTNTSDTSIKEEIDPGIVQVSENETLEIVKYPHPSLRSPNALVTEFNGAELKLFIKQMFKMMYASNGVGLAAPQVGINKRILVFNPKGDSKAFLQEVALINPKIIRKSPKLEDGPEGCLSFPNIGGEISRHVWVEVEAFRANGKKFKVKYTGWEAVIFQHEYDHLDGIVFIDRMNEKDKKQNENQLKTLIESYNGPTPIAL